jgi:chlorinating enzyme
MPILLTASQVQSYEEEGYLFPIRGLTAEQGADTVARVRDLERRHSKKGRDYVHRTLLRFKPHLLYPWLDEVIRAPRILDAVEDVIGPDILVWASALFIKDARDPGYVAWHQDSITYGLAGKNLVTAWLALTDAHIDNAAMRFIPSSHKLGSIRHVETDDEHNVLSRGEVVDMQVDESKSVNVILDAGEMSFHHLDLLHSSPPNDSDRPRIGYAIRYMPTSMRHNHEVATAMLVRGTDAHGHFELEPAPRQEDDPVALEAHAHAMEIRKKSVFASH